MIKHITRRGIAPLLLVAMAISVGLLVHPSIAKAACTDSGHAGALVPAAHVGQSVTVRVYTTTDTPVNPMSADINRPNGTLFSAGPYNFGAKTPGGFYFAPVTFTPTTTGTWKVKYSIGMSGCSGLYTATANVPVTT